MQANRVVVGRQAIGDRDRRVTAYELQFHPLGEPADGEDDADEVLAASMTAEVVFAALNIGLRHLVGGKQLYLAADEAVLTGAVDITLPAGQTVVEVSRELLDDPANRAGVARLSAAGFGLAVLDLDWSEEVEPFLALGTIAGLDVRRPSGRPTADIVAQCERLGVRVLARGLETVEEFETYREAGCALFQGPLLEQPVVVSGRTIEPGHLTRLKMATTLMSSELDFNELGAMLQADPGLAYQIMKLAGIGRPGETRRQVNTIREALVLAGSRRIQNWMAMLLARPETPDADDLVTRTLIRARACELLTERLNHDEASMGFAAGLLSALELLLGIPAAELTRTLPIGDELAAAAFGDRSEVARIVRDAENYQLATPGPGRHSQLSEAEIAEAFAQAFSWTMLGAQALSS